MLDQFYDDLYDRTRGTNDLEDFFPDDFVNYCEPFARGGRFFCSLVKNYKKLELSSYRINVKDPNAALLWNFALRRRIVSRGRVYDLLERFGMDATHRLNNHSPKEFERALLEDRRRGNPDYYASMLSNPKLREGAARAYYLLASSMGQNLSYGEDSIRCCRGAFSPALNGEKPNLDDWCEFIMKVNKNGWELNEENAIVDEPWYDFCDEAEEGDFIFIDPLPMDSDDRDALFDTVDDMDERGVKILMLLNGTESEKRRFERMHPRPLSGKGGWAFANY